ncbi:unnamed protein product [Protopolystoma xenopodis]|uniref:Uncharacterized protein n=1 Tax=Protopolystoma xenopodis TaxID=117903 RepID=A0A3S5BR47_9PLAT|nr:unnamed protein product [Protopolystoma xenopodis]
MMGESSASFHPKRGSKSCELSQHEHRIKAKRLQYNAIHPSSSGEIDLRISSQEIHRNPASRRIFKIMQTLADLDAYRSRTKDPTETPKLRPSNLLQKCSSDE